jgi:hypothetical protein
MRLRLGAGDCISDDGAWMSCRSSVTTARVRDCVSEGMSECAISAPSARFKYSADA